MKLPKIEYRCEYGHTSPDQDGMCPDCAERSRFLWPTVIFWGGYLALWLAFVIWRFCCKG